MRNFVLKEGDVVILDFTRFTCVGTVESYDENSNALLLKDLGVIALDPQVGLKFIPTIMEFGEGSILVRPDIIRKAKEEVVRSYQSFRQEMQAAKAGINIAKSKIIVENNIHKNKIVGGR